MLNDTILIDLDALLDRRIAAINAVYPDIALRAMETQGYFKRTNDDFSSLDARLKGFNVMDVDINRIKDDVYPTNVANMLADHASNCRVAGFASIMIQEVNITVNCSGWNMVEEERLAMAKGLIGMLGTDKIQVVELSDDELMPLKLKASYTKYITYDVDAWMLRASTSLRDNPIPSVEILAPYRVIKENVQGMSHQEIVESTRTSLAPFVTLTLLPLEHFSLLKIK